jgi:hypothetical protein
MSNPVPAAPWEPTLVPLNPEPRQVVREAVVVVVVLVGTVVVVVVVVEVVVDVVEAGVLR